MPPGKAFYERWLDEGGEPLPCLHCGADDGYPVEGMVACDDCYGAFVRACDRLARRRPSLPHAEFLDRGDLLRINPRAAWVVNSA